MIGRVLAVLILAATGLVAQVDHNKLVFVVADPSGACANRTALEYNPLSGSLWACKNSVWNAIGGAGGGGATPGAPTTSVQFNNAGAFGGNASFTWDATGKILHVIGASGSSNSIQLGGTGYANGGVFDGNPTDNTLGVIGPNDGSIHGGLGVQGYSDGVVPGMSFQVYPSGAMLSAITPVFYFTALDSFDDQGFKGATLWGVDNDFKKDGPNGHYALQLLEKHGLLTSGYPDSVGFFGINTSTPGAVFHALNPTTDDDDDPKNYVVSLIEGRADQVADLTQWKKTGGSTLAAISASGTLKLSGSTSGTATVTPQAAAGTPTLTLPTTSGTLASTATSPLVLNATTGVLTCPTCQTAATTVVHSFGATFDGSGSALTVGTKAYFTVPYACTIQAWNATVDTGTITFDIWKIATGSAIPTVANTITASALPAISSGTALHSTTLTAWNVTVTANDIVAVNINAVASATKASLAIQCQ